MSEHHTCHCGRPAPGTNLCNTTRIGCCAGCKRLFSSDSAFEKHRRNSSCREPEECGLIARESGTAPGEVVWSLPGGYFAAERGESR